MSSNNGCILVFPWAEPQSYWHASTCTNTLTHSLTTPWTRNSNSLLLVALRAPPAESSMSIYKIPSLSFVSSIPGYLCHCALPWLFLSSKRECSLPPSPPSDVPFLHSLSLFKACQRVARVESLSLSVLVQLPSQTLGLEGWGSVKGVVAGPPMCWGMPLKIVTHGKQDYQNTATVLLQWTVMWR